MKAIFEARGELASIVEIQARDLVSTGIIAKVISLSLNPPIESMPIALTSKFQDIEYIYLGFIKKNSDEYRTKICTVGSIDSNGLIYPQEDYTENDVSAIYQINKDIQKNCQKACINYDEQFGI